MSATSEAPPDSAPPYPAAQHPEHASYLQLFLRPLAYIGRGFKTIWCFFMVILADLKSHVMPLVCYLWTVLKVMLLFFFCVCLIIVLFIWWAGGGGEDTPRTELPEKLRPNHSLMVFCFLVCLYFFFG